MKRFVPLIALITFISVYAGQQKVSISGGFFTGRDYLQMSETERRAYATGAINGMLVAPFFGAPSENLDWLKDCTGKMSDAQIATVLTNHINSQPGNLQANLNVVTFNAIQGTCKNIKQ